MIIGITGKKQSGKSTLSKCIKQNYLNFIELNFADPLKNSIKEIFNLSEDQINGDLKEINDTKYNFTPRELMQWMGTDVFRNTFHTQFPNSPPVWISNMEYRLKKLYPKNNIIVSDVRFNNEANLIKMYGGYIIKVTSNDNIYSNHEAENQIINFDYEIINNKESNQSVYLNNLNYQLNKIMNLIEGD